MKREAGLDFLKFICSFMVICIHIQFPKPIGLIVTPITRMAVPSFFMITGYFYSLVKVKNNEKMQIKKMGMYFLHANVLFFLFSLCKYFLQNKTAMGFWGQIFSLKSMVEFLLLNESPFGGHLWYLGAIFYVLLIVFFVDKISSRKVLYNFIPFLLLADLVLGKYSILISGREFPYILVRNFMFVGLPYFMIGDLLFNCKLKLKFNSLVGFTIFFTFTTLLERLILGTLNANGTRDHYLSTTFLAISVVLLALNCEGKVDNRLYKFFCFVGNKLTLNIYILHPIFIEVLSKIISMSSCNKSVQVVVGYVSPFLVFGISIITSGILHVWGKSVWLRKCSGIKKEKSLVNRNT